MLKTLIFYVTTYTFIVIFSAMYLLRALFYWLSTLNKPIEKIDLSNPPSCLNDPAVGTHGSVRLHKRDIEIHYVANGDRKKPLMLFLHGFPEFWYVWKHQLQEFGKDYYAVAIDMTGYGESSKPSDVKRYAAVEIATDVKEFLSEMGFESCVLVGHDWGGSISYVVAQMYPEIVERLIVINCPNKKGFSKGLNFKQLLMSSYMFFFQIPMFPEAFLSMRNCEQLNMMREGPLAIKNPEKFTAEDLLAYKYTFLKGGFTSPLNYYRNVFRPPGSQMTKSGEKKSKKITVRSLIIWGTEDAALGKQLAIYSAEAIEQCDLEFVEGGSHFVNVEYPDEVNKIMRDYLKKTL